MSVMDDQALDFDGLERVLSEGPFEEALAALERVVKILEAGNLPLADSVRCYEVGNRLADRCGRLLDDAELRISRLDQSETSDVPF